MERISGSPEVKIGLIDGPVVIQHADLTGEHLREIPGNNGATCTQASGTACLRGTFVAATNGMSNHSERRLNTAYGEIVMRTFFIASVALLSAFSAESALAHDLSAHHMIDLTHSFNEKTIYWPTDTQGFKLEQLAHGKTDAGFFYAANALCTAEHGGTHLDAPLHFVEGKRSTEQIPLKQLIARAVVIDVSRQAGLDRDYRLSREDVLKFEKRHGKIAPGTIAILRTGWSKRWPDRKKYLGDDTPGDASKLSFPSFGAEAATLLVEQRKIAMLGIDTASIDYGRSKDFIVHRIAAAENVVGLENLMNLDKLPPTGATIIALPMKIEGGSGGPARVIALIARLR